MWGAHGHPISPPDIWRWCSLGRTACPLAGLSRCHLHVSEVQPQGGRSRLFDHLIGAGERRQQNSAMRMAAARANIGS